MVVASDILRKNVLRIDANKTLSEALGAIIKNREPCLVVFDGNSLVGILSHRALLRKRVVYSYAKLKNFVDEFVPNVGTSDNLLKIISLMHQSGSRVLPVFQDGTLMGFVHICDVLKSAFDEFDISEMKLKDIASEALTLEHNDKLAKLLALMRENNIKQVPIVDKNNNLQGVVTLETLIDRYFIHATPKRELFSLRGHEPEAKNIFNMPLSGLAEEAITARPNQTLGSVKEHICNGETIVLVENNKPKGIVTTRNVLEAILKKARPERNIQLSNMPEFSEPDKKRALQRINTFYDKACKLLAGELFLSIHFKCYEKRGMRKKHVVHARLSGAGFNAKAQAQSWNALSALQNALDELSREIIKYREKK
ncbi:MAG: CBS domain-containing protein [Candidatus Diapherotrites archaeon]|nr:CBS domain-containing protein [Candidatus Diapherotrites archaeon]